MRLMRRTVVLSLFLAVALGAAAHAAPSGKPNAVEARVVAAMQADIGRRFPTAAEAEAAGYVRYTNQDETGAISYANRKWQSPDPQHPSQLWYDTSGKLLGADLSVLKHDDVRPHRFGMLPARWSVFPAHVHYVAIDPATHEKIYDKDVSVAKFRAAGGDPAHPQAETLVKLGLVKSADDIAIVFLFPDIWDISLWLRPNPNGAFADKNPLVVPTKP